MCRMPKGITDFELLRKNNYVYIDKTKYIEALENGSERYVHFLRPRRFGKTLFTSTLSAYYDINATDKFDELFKGTYIYDHQTKEKNQYYILRFDFSSLNTDTIETLKTAFHNRIYSKCKAFIEQYKLDFELEKGIDAADCVSQFLDRVSTRLNQSIYLIVDEYDQFANELLSFHINEFGKAVSENGYVRKFYEALKSATVDSTIGRIFITGVSPITLDSMTSGYNISTNLTLDSDYNELCGFTMDEMKYLVSLVDHISEPEEVLAEMKQLYDGYQFNTDVSHHIYNPNMTLYYLEYMQRKKVPPEEIVDPNIYSDYKKIQNLLKIKTYSNQSNSSESFKEKTDALTDIMKYGQIKCHLTSSFELSTKYTKDDFISLLYYLGYLTISDSYRDVTNLKVPNDVIKTVYFEYFNAMLENAYHIDTTVYSNIVSQLLDEKQNELLVKQIEISLQGLSNRDYTKFDEKYVKLIAMSIVGVSNYIRIESEKEVNGGYADLIFYPYKTTGATSIIELKYLKKEDVTDQRIKEKRDEAFQQLKKYTDTKEFKGIDVVKWILIFSKDQCVWNETIE